MADWFVDPLMENLMEKLTDACSEYLKDQFRWQTGMKKELERLRENHPKIQAVVSAASQAQMMLDPDSPLNKWIWQLRDAIDEAEDVLDDFEYQKHEEQLLRNAEETKKLSAGSSLSGFAQKLRRFGERALKIDPNLARLEEVVQKLDRVSAEVSTFHYLLENAKQEQQVQQDELQKYRETGSLPKDDLIGRGEEKEFVIQWLRKSPNEEHRSHVTAIPRYYNISLLSIVGDGGLGKTTLLQHIYEDEMTKEFDLKIWVCISNNFDVKKVLTDMLESLKKTRPSMESLDTLQNSLKSEVMSMKFLLVLDDIWEEDEEQDKRKWEDVLAPFAHGGLGSKILITTRMNSAASMIAKAIKKKNETLILEGLKEDECLELLNIHAFADVENMNDHKRLRSITEELVKKLYGSPLATKVIGGVLNSNLDERYWRNVLNNVLGYNESFSIIKLSYIFLPKYLQNCFAFCSIFRQDHIFHKDDLIRMWIAVGFIQPSDNRGEDVEDIGGRYFNILVKKSFFDNVERGYKMHDLLHELAQIVSKQECFRSIMHGEELLSQIPETIRHLFVETSNLELFKKIGKFKNLRTLCIDYDGQDNQGFVNVLTKTFEGTRAIRLLFIRAWRQKMIPETIGCLKHLRYMELYFSSYTSLPRSVSNLYHLQILICNNYSKDDFFPSDMNNLSNLRFLRTYHYMFPGIGKLKFLQEIDEFVVKNESGYKFEELEHLNDLRILGIQGFENVRDAQDACKAKLCDKRKLTDLSLHWKVTSQNNTDLDIYARVLDNLQPHNNVKKLTMRNYRGARSARWMENADLINNLEDITLDRCLEWQILPPFGQLPFLKSLCLLNMPKAERFENKFDGNEMCSDFPSLVKLSIHYVPQLTNIDNPNCMPFCLPSLSSLTYLSISKVPQLRELPDLPPSLCKLKLHNLDNLNCLPSCLPTLSSLTKLYIENVPQLRELPDLPPSLCSLYLANLANLNCQLSCLHTLSSLIILSICNVPQLRELPNLIPSLRELHLHNIDNLDCLPSCFPTLSSLYDINISNVPQLRELSDLPPSLCKLSLRNIDNLNCLPSCLSTLSSFDFLFIDNVPQLRELPYLPPSLHVLELHNLDNLYCLPSCLPTLCSLTLLHINTLPQLRELPDLPPSLHKLILNSLDNLNCLSSCLPTLSSLTKLTIIKVPQLWELPYLPSSLLKLKLIDLDNLNCMPSCLPTLSSLKVLFIIKVPRLRELPDLPLSLCELTLKSIDNLNCLPSCLPTISCLTNLVICKVPQLRELPVLPPSLHRLFLINLDNLNCPPSLLLTLSSLIWLSINTLPQLQKLSYLPPSLYTLWLENLDNLNCLPSCLPNLSSVIKIYIKNVPQLRELPDLPPSLHILHLKNLDNLNCLPSCFPTLSSLTELSIKNVPQLQELPDLPPSLHFLHLENLDNLNCLPSCFPTLSSLKELSIKNVPQLHELPDLPPSLKKLEIR